MKAYQKAAEIVRELAAEYAELVAERDRYKAMAGGAGGGFGGNGGAA